MGPHYAASKAGIIGLTNSYPKLLASEGITVNSVNPALVVTDMLPDTLQPTMVPVGRYGNTCTHDYTTSIRAHSEE